tara:strand:+ start:560 stop:661 length:102 start_codon:yes stop_codon:yes gene_type:complete
MAGEKTQEKETTNPRLPVAIKAGSCVDETVTNQ